MALKVVSKTRQEKNRHEDSALDENQRSKMGKTRTRSKKREDITLSESNNDSLSSNESTCSLPEPPILPTTAPIYSNFPITDFYSLHSHLDERLPKTVYQLCRHILYLDIEVSPVNAFYKGAFMPDIEKQVELVKTFGAQFGVFSKEEDKKLETFLDKLLSSNVVFVSPKDLFTALRQVQLEADLKEYKFTLNIVGLYVGQQLPDRIAAQLCDRLLCLLFHKLTGQREVWSRNISEDSFFSNLNSTLRNGKPRQGGPLSDFPADLSRIHGPQNDRKQNETFADFPKDLSSISFPRVTLNSSEEESFEESM